MDIDEIVIGRADTGQADLATFFGSHEWGDWCQHDVHQGTISVPVELSSPDRRDNGIAVILQPDLTLVEVSMFKDCETFHGGWLLPRLPEDRPHICEPNDGLSWYGGHGGSHLTALGGLIRLGELSHGGALEHVLGVEIDHSVMYCAEGEVDGQAGFRWPANSADSAACRSGDPHRYIGDNPSLQMGSLLAVPTGMDCSVLDTEPGRRICEALKTYGAVVKDNSAVAGEVAFPMEVGVRQELIEAYGIDPMNAQGAYASDIDRIFRVAVIVDNPMDSWTVEPSNPPPIGYDEDGDGYDETLDCNTGLDFAYPGAPELADWVDNDCDSPIDEGCSSNCNGDYSGGCYDDFQTFHEQGSLSHVCTGLTGDVDWDNDGVNNSEDCEPEDTTIYPGAQERANFKDDNCNGAVDEGCNSGCQTDYSGCCWDDYSAWYEVGGSPNPWHVCTGDAADEDQDGYLCGVQDCMDWDPLSHPGAAERSDWNDNNCDGRIDEGCDDHCGGNYSSGCHDDYMWYYEEWPTGATWCHE